VEIDVLASVRIHVSNVIPIFCGIIETVATTENDIDYIHIIYLEVTLYNILHISIKKLSFSKPNKYLHIKYSYKN